MASCANPTLLKALRNIAVLLLSSSFAGDIAIAISPPQPPGSMLVERVQLVQGVEYLVAIRPDFTQFDTVAFEFAVFNHKDQAVELILSKEEAGPQLELVDAQGREHRRSISFSTDCRTFSYTKWMKPYSHGLSVRVDLTKVFGKLLPGEYRLSVSWPTNSLQIKTDTDSFSGEIRSKSLTFVVHEAHFEAAVAKFNQTMASKMEFVDDKPDHGRRPRRAVLTNTQNVPIVVYYDESWGKWPYNGRHGLILSEIETVRWAVRLSYLMPKRDPVDPEFRKTKVVQPAQRLEIALPEWECDENGVYRFQCSYYLQKPDSPNELVFGGTLVTKPFIVDLTTDK